MNRKRGREVRGFTLLEMVVAVSAAGILVAGMMSSIFIAMRAVDKSSTPAAATLEGTRVLTEVALDLQDANSLAVQTPTVIVAYVPDRDENTIDELIQYVWSGVAGNALYRIYTNGTTEVVVDDVHEFLVEYRISPKGKRYVNVAIQVSDNSAARVETAFAQDNL